MSPSTTVLRIPLRREMYLELLDATRRCAKPDEPACPPEEFAKECIESALATRRLERMARL
jgi:hypothetical protein